MRQAIRPVIAAFASLAVALAPAAMAANDAGCVGAGSSCVLTLVGPGAPSVVGCKDEPWASFVALTLPGQIQDADADGWFEAVLELDLDPVRGCGCVRFCLELDAIPTLFTLNIGDSPTNDGYGGDNFTTGYAAEAQLEDNILKVFSGVSDHQSLRMLGPEALLTQRLPAGESRELGLTICDQQITVESGTQEPTTVTVATPVTQRLFALAGQDHRAVLGRGQVGDYRVFAAFNRFIRERTGDAVKGRLGTGIRRVELTLYPDPRPHSHSPTEAQTR